MTLVEDFAVHAPPSDHGREAAGSEARRVARKLALAQFDDLNNPSPATAEALAAADKKIAESVDTTSG